MTRLPTRTVSTLNTTEMAMNTIPSLMTHPHPLRTSGGSASRTATTASSTESNAKGLRPISGTSMAAPAQQSHALWIDRRPRVHAGVLADRMRSTSREDRYRRQHSDDRDI